MMPINYDVEYPKLRMKYGKALQRIEKLEADLTLEKSWQQVEYATRTNLEQRIEQLEAKLIRANYLIDELEGHEGAEGWSEYLRIALAERNE